MSPASRSSSRRGPTCCCARATASDVTAYRPDDHVWHKGLSLALPVVGPHNFWGGPTYVRGEGYVQLPNNGAQVHTSFAASDTPVAEAAGGIARLDERLDWVTQQGDLVLREARTITARLLSDDAWALTWRSALRNESTDAVAFGSPTTKGRENAGYAGLFWRGPAEFTGGAILGPDGEVGDTARGGRDRGSRSSLPTSPPASSCSTRAKPRTRGSRAATSMRD